MPPNSAAWMFAIAATASCVSSPAIPPKTPVEPGYANHVCNVANVATKVSDRKFELSVSMHQEGQGKCLETLDAIAETEAIKLCGTEPHRVTGGDGKLTITADGGPDRQGSADANYTYTIQCGNAA